MKKITTAILLMVFSANALFADEYRVVQVHNPGLFEAIGGLIVTVVTLPVVIVVGVAKGATRLIAGSDETVVVNTTPQPYVAAYAPQPAYATPVVAYQQPYYYNQPYYSAAPFNPGYQFNSWYWQPNNCVVFVAGNEHRRHNFNHNGNYGGRRIQYR